MIAYTEMTKIFIFVTLTLLQATAPWTRFEGHKRMRITKGNHVIFKFILTHKIMTQQT